MSSFNYCTLVDSIQAHFKTTELTKILMDL